MIGRFGLKATPTVGSVSTPLGDAFAAFVSFEAMSHAGAVATELAPSGVCDPPGPSVTTPPASLAGTEVVVGAVCRGGFACAIA